MKKTIPLSLPAGPGCTVIKLADALRFFGAPAVEALEQRFEIRHFGPWQIPVSVTGLAVTATWKPGPTHDYVDHYTLHGRRTMNRPTQSGYAMEGLVSVGGKKLSAFTSSILFQIEESGKLLEIATLHCRTPKAKA